MAGVIAFTNISDSLFMVISAVGTSIFLAFGFSIPDIFWVIAMLTVIAAFVIRSAVREQMKQRETLLNENT
jgi:acyl-[acyl-carrier-protein]-phospholipid O-acyltransferase/long-chain-fatty-acid--[acyl-carrier-protein] ligase